MTTSIKDIEAVLHDAFSDEKGSPRATAFILLTYPSNRDQGRLTYSTNDDNIVTVGDLEDILKELLQLLGTASTAH